MDNGSGDTWSVVFSPAGTFLRKFDHESSMNLAANDGKLWPGLVDSSPVAADRRRPMACWQHQLSPPVPILMVPVGCSPRCLTRQAWRTTAPRRTITQGHRFDAVRQTFALSPLTTSLVRRLTADRSAAALLASVLSR